MKKEFENALKSYPESEYSSIQRKEKGRERIL